MASVPGQGMASSFFRICRENLRVETQARGFSPPPLQIKPTKKTEQNNKT